MGRENLEKLFVRPILVIVLFFIVFGIMGLGLFRLETRTSEWDLIPKDFESSRALEEIDISMGGVDYQSILIENIDFSEYETIKAILLLGEALEEEFSSKGMTEMRHYLTGFVFNMKKETGIENIKPYFMMEGRMVEIPDGSSVLFEDAITDGVNMYLDNPTAWKWTVHKSLLLSEDMRSGQIMVKISPDLTPHEREDLARQIESFSLSNFDVDGAVIGMTGGSAISADIREFVMKNTSRLGLIAVMLVVFILYFSIRNITEILMLLLSLALTLLFVFGFMGWFGLAYNIISVALIPLVLGISLANSLFIINRYKEERSVENSFAAASKALKTAGKAVMMAAFTTMFGFIVFLLSDLPVLREFGIISAVGVSASFLISSLFLLSCLVLRDKKSSAEKGMRVSNIEQKLYSKIADFLTALSIKHSRNLIIAFMLLILFGFATSLMLKTTSDLRTLIPADLPSIATQHKMESALGGQQQDFILVKGNIVNDASLLAISEASEYLSQSKTFSENDVVALSELLEDIIIETNPESKDKSFSELLSEVGGAEGAFASLLEYWGPPGDLISVDLETTVINVNSEAASGRAEIEMRRKALDNAAEIIRDRGLNASVGGVTPLTDDMTSNLVKTNYRSSLLSLTLSGLFLMIIFGSVIYGLSALGALAAAVSVQMFFMAVMRWELDMLNVLTASLIIGMGIDYGIHVSHRLREEIEKADGYISIEDAVRNGINSLFIPLFGSALSTVGAFSIIATSSMTTIHRFGSIAAVSITASFFAGILFIPSLILSFSRKAHSKAVSDSQVS